MIAYITFLITPLFYLLFFREKLHFFTGVSPKKFLIVYVFLSLMITSTMFILLLDNCGLAGYNDILEIIQGGASLLAIILGLIFFRNIIFKKE